MIALTSGSVKYDSEEQNLLIQLVEGDRDAFWAIWNRYQDYLFSRCRAWMGGNYFDAEEALSLTALKAWQKLPDHASSITNLKGWLNRLAHNLCIDLHRKRKRQALGIENIEEIQDSIQFIEDFTPSNCHNPEADLLQKEFKTYLRYYIEQLPPRLREPLKLRYYQGLSCIEIGEVLSIKQNTVSKRLQEAKSFLRKLLCEYSSGLSETKINEENLQESERIQSKLTTQIDSIVEEISYGVTISCLETLPPVWFSSLQGQAWT